MALLNASHRCDSCSGRAYSQITLLSGRALFFCGHHLKKNYDALVMHAANILDETGELTLHITDDKHVV